MTRITFKQLTVGTKILVRNLENGAEARFVVDEVFLFGIKFFPMRVLCEISIAAAVSGDWYPLGYLRRKTIGWEILHTKKEI